MMCRKLNDNRGETLVEMLASILIAALAVALLFTCCMASVQMGSQAQAADERYYENLSAAEKQEVKLTENAEVIVANADDPTVTQPVDVSLYGGDGMYSYQWKEAEPVDP